MRPKDNIIKFNDEAKMMNNGAAWSLEQYWKSILYQYALPIVQFCISFIYGIYLRLTFINVVTFFLKYVPTAIYMNRFIKNIYVTSRERIKQKQIELENIQLQIQLMNTKLSVRDVEFSEREDELQRGAERLRRVRARVRDVIATDDQLRRALEGVAMWNIEHDIDLDSTSKEDRELIVELIKELKSDSVCISERQTEKMDCGERAPPETNSTENSVYSSISDIDIRQDCRVQIVKVTNVYKVAYLKHFIKQKRLRRASKQAIMNKKIANIKKLLEDWQRTLSKMINNKLTILNMETHPMDIATQEARGDYSKITASSDSDSDQGNNNTNNMSYDDYNFSWAHNPYRTCAYSQEYVPETVVSAESKHQYYGDMKCSDYYENTNKSSLMVSIIEETSSQIAIEDVKSDTEEEPECTDLVII